MKFLVPLFCWAHAMGMPIIFYLTRLRSPDVVTMRVENMESTRYHLAPKPGRLCTGHARELEKMIMSHNSRKQPVALATQKQRKQNQTDMCLCRRKCVVANVSCCQLDVTSTNHNQYDQCIMYYIDIYLHA